MQDPLPQGYSASAQMLQTSTRLTSEGNRQTTGNYERHLGGKPRGGLQAVDDISPLRPPGNSDTLGHGKGADHP